MSDTDSAAQAAVKGHFFCWVEFDSKDAAATAKFMILFDNFMFHPFLLNKLDIV